MKQEKRILQTYCPKCDIQGTPCGGAAKKAEKHERLYCPFCRMVLELWEFVSDKQTRIETHVGVLKLI
jgi:hypothetical protein